MYAKTEKSHISTVLFDAKIQVNLCFRWNMQVGRHKIWKVLCYYYKKKWISRQNTFRAPGRWLRIVFLSNEDVFSRLKLHVFFIHPNYEKNCFQNSTLPAYVKTEVESDLLLILRVINFSCSSSQWFRGARQDASEHSMSRTRSSTNCQNWTNSEDI